MKSSVLRWVIAILVAFTAPVVFGFDLLARMFVVGTQPPDVQEFMALHVTRFAWWALPFPIIGAIGGILFYPWLYKRLLKRHRANPPAGSTPEQRADLEALFLASSMVQLPALLGDFSVLLGARLTPAICSMSISTIGVLLIVLMGGQMAHKS